MYSKCEQKWCTRMVIMAPKQSLGDILCLLRFLLSVPIKVWENYCERLIVFAPFLIIIKSPKLIVFAPFLIIIFIFINIILILLLLFLLSFRGP